MQIVMTDNIFHGNELRKNQMFVHNDGTNAWIACLEPEANQFESLPGFKLMAREQILWGIRRVYKVAASWEKSVLPKIQEMFGKEVSMIDH